MQDIIETLNWRYATKKFDPTKKLSTEQLDTIMEAMRLAPSSFGIQPWKFYLVETPAIREEMKAASWGQAQVTDASHFVVVSSRIGLQESDVDRFVDDIKKTRKQSSEDVAQYRDMMIGSVTGMSATDRDSWCARQSYIALGFGLSAAAQMGVDACPMEGFDPAKINDILGIEADGYTARAYMALGFRSPDDAYATEAKVRFPKESVWKRV